MDSVVAFGASGLSDARVGAPRVGRDCLVASDSAVVSVFVACPGAKGCIIVDGVVVWLDGAAAIGAVDVAGAGDVGVLLVDDDDVLGVVLVDEDVVVLVEGTVEVTGAAPITVDEATGVNVDVLVSAVVRTSISTPTSFPSVAALLYGLALVSRKLPDAGSLKPTSASDAG